MFRVALVGAIESFDLVNCVFRSLALRIIVIIIRAVGSSGGTGARGANCVASRTIPRNVSMFSAFKASARGFIFGLILFTQIMTRFVIGRGSGRFIFIIGSTI